MFPIDRRGFAGHISGMSKTSAMPRFIAHRGAAKSWPENTLPAFRHALEAGMDGLEFDLQRTADDRLAVYHDPTLNPETTKYLASHETTNSAWLSAPGAALSSLTAAELAAYDVGQRKPDSAYFNKFPDRQDFPATPIAFVEDVFALVRNQTEPPLFSGDPPLLFAELKTGLHKTGNAAAEKCAELYHRHLMASGGGLQPVSISFDWRCLLYLQNCDPAPICHFTTLPFSCTDPTRKDGPANAASFRALSQRGGIWLGDYDWRDQKGADHDEKMLTALSRTGATGWLAWHGDITARTVELARARDLQITAWTVNTPTEAARLIALGIDNLITDDPALRQKVETSAVPAP